MNHSVDLIPQRRLSLKIDLREKETLLKAHPDHWTKPRFTNGPFQRQLISRSGSLNVRSRAIQYMRK